MQRKRSDLAPAFSIEAMAQLLAAAEMPLKRGGKRANGNGEVSAMTAQIAGNVSGSVGSVLLSKGYVGLLLSSAELVPRTEAGDKVLALLGPLISTQQNSLAVAAIVALQQWRRYWMSS